MAPSRSSASSKHNSMTMSTATPEKHQEFWLHDGSIILHVEGTLFKVHQTILANHSEVFKDLFSLPQPVVDEGEGDGGIEGIEGAPETMEGCHVVQLQDSGEDFVDLLRAIYQPGYFESLPANADLDALITFVGGILRLSTKYIIKELRRRCISLLMTRFPTTFEEYTAKTNQRQALSPVPAAREAPTTADLQALANLITFTLMPAVGGTTPQGTPPPLSTMPSMAQLSGQTLGSSSIPSIPVIPSANSNSYGLQPHAPPAQLPPLPPPPPPPPPVPQHHASSSHTHRHNRTLHSNHPQSSNQNSNSHSHSHRRKSRAPKATTPEPAPPKPKTSSIMRAITLAHQTNAQLILPYAYYLLARTSSPRRFLTHSAMSWHHKTICLVGRSLLHSAEISMSHSFLVAFQAAPRCNSPTQCAASKGPLMEWALLEASGKGPEPLRQYDRWDRLGVCGECLREAKRKHESGREEVWQRLPGFFELEGWDELRNGQDR